MRRDPYYLLQGKKIYQPDFIILNMHLPNPCADNFTETITIDWNMEIDPQYSESK